MLANGFSLLGVTVAVGILSAGILATTSVMARTENAVGLSRERLVAIGLAREGLELVQAKRDSNWFDQAAGTPGVTSWVSEVCDDPPATDDFMFTIESVPGSTPPLVVLDPTAANYDPKLYLQQTTNRFTHDNNGTANEETLYSREIHVDCTFANPADPATEDARIEARAIVSWSSRGEDREVELKTRFYDWRI